MTKRWNPWNDWNDWNVWNRGLIRRLERSVQKLSQRLISFRLRLNGWNVLNQSYSSVIVYLNFED